MIADLEIQVFNMLQSLFDRFGWWGVMALTVVESATGFSPSELVLGLAGWLLLAAHDAPVPMIFLAGLYTALASLVGSSIPYWAARLGGRPLIERALRLFQINPSYLALAETQFQHWGPGLVFFGRVLPLVRVMVNIPAGLMRMPYLQFLAFTFLGAYVWCTLFIGLGYTIGHEWWRMQDQVGEVLPFVFIGMFVLGAAAWLARHKLQQRLHLQPVEMGPDEENQRAS